MDKKLKQRIMMFYVGGVINALLFLYVVIEGRNFLPSDTVRTMSIVFFLFALVDFYFPYALKKKWQADIAKKMAQGNPGQLS